MQKIWNFLLELPSNIVNGIINGIKELFLPADNFFDNIVAEIKQNIATKIPYEVYLDVFGSLTDGSYYDGEKDLNIKLEGYKISDNLTINQDFINFDNIIKYKDTWYSWIRGFIFILLIIYNLNEAIKLLRGYNVAANVASYNQSSGGGDK